MSSVKVKFRASQNEGHEGTVYYQVIHERVVRQWYSDYRLLPEEWDSAKSRVVVAGNAERREYVFSVGRRIRYDLARLGRIIAVLEGGKEAFTADNVVEEFARQESLKTLPGFMKATIARLRELGQRRTSETYSSALNSFSRFIGGREVLLDAIDSELMESYQAYLKGEGLVPNTISFYMRILKATYHRAVERGLTEDCTPFRHVYTGVDKTTRRAVDLATIRKIKEADLSADPKAAFARDMFMLSFYLRGMSFVDMAHLKKTDLSEGTVTYRRRKTGQKLTVKWVAEMQEVLDRYPENTTEYLLPIITSGKSAALSQYRARQYQVNRGLKTVAGKIGLQMTLTLYCSRHSWASIAKSNGIPVGVISDGLGHDSELTTQIYLSTLDTSAVDNANALIMRLL